MRLKLALLYVKDLEVMTRFYENVLGAAVTERSPGYVVLDAQLALHAIPPQYAADIAIAVPPVAREEAATKLVFVTDDVGAACVRVEALGGIALPERWPGARDVLDPEGNVFQLTAH